jgi:hypothetical protein
MKYSFLLLCLALLTFACKRGDDTSRDAEIRDSVNVHHDANGMSHGDTVNTNPELNEFAEFSVTNGSISLQLRDKKSTIPMSSLGTATDTLTRKLTLTSDTHQGSTVQDYKYEDLNLEFFMPKGSSDPWLMAIELKNSNWSTARGIRVGDTVADLKSMYPKASNEFNEDKLTYIYTVDDSQLMFGTTGDKITRIKIQYNLQ